jgi:hypothetical protein
MISGLCHEADENCGILGHNVCTDTHCLITEEEHSFHLLYRPSVQLVLSFGVWKNSTDVPLYLLIQYPQSTAARKKNGKLMK